MYTSNGFMLSSNTLHNHVLFIKSKNHHKLLLQKQDAIVADDLNESLTSDEMYRYNAYLENIEKYGEARMARKAIKLLDKMRSNNLPPLSSHFTATLWACESTLSYDLAVPVFNDMFHYNIPRLPSTYNAMISISEKTGHWKQAIDFLHMMNDEGLVADTNIYNAAMWAADKGGHWELALDLLKEMESFNIPRDATTYAAVAWACEKGGVGDTALHVLDLMHEDNIDMNIPTYRGAMWACVKSGMWKEALNLFYKMDDEGLSPCMATYTAAIWACEVGNDADKAVKLLRLSKIDTRKRDTGGFDGAIRALANQGRGSECKDLLSWMRRDGLTPTQLSYSSTIAALIYESDLKGQDPCAIAETTYLEAVRDGYFSPWVEGTRLIDISEQRGFDMPTARLALTNVLRSMKDGTLPLFNLGIAYESIGSDNPNDNVAVGNDGTGGTIAMNVETTTKKLNNNNNNNNDDFGYKEDIEKDLIDEDIAAVIQREELCMLDPNNEDNRAVAKIRCAPVTAVAIKEFLKTYDENSSILAQNIREVEMDNKKRLVILRDQLVAWTNIGP